MMSKHQQTLAHHRTCAAVINLFHCIIIVHTNERRPEDKQHIQLASLLVCIPSSWPRCFAFIIVHNHHHHHFDHRLDMACQSSVCVCVTHTFVFTDGLPLLVCAKANGTTNHLTESKQERERSLRNDYCSHQHQPTHLVQSLDCWAAQLIAQSATNSQ